MSKAYFGGLPTQPDVNRLNEAFALKVGDEIRHEQIEAVLGVSRNSNRYRTVTNAWRNNRRMYGLELGSVTGVGFRVLDPAERIDRGYADVRSGVRKQLRAIDRTSAVITDDPALQKKQEVLHRYGLAVRREATEMRKQIEPPKPQAQLPRAAPSSLAQQA